MLDPREWNDGESADYAAVVKVAEEFAEAERIDGLYEAIDVLYGAGASPEFVDVIIHTSDALKGRWN
jgi:hypothetical protein